MSGIIAAPDPISLTDICVASEELLSSCLLHVGNATIYSNLGELNLPFHKHLRDVVYTKRTCNVDPVVLVRLDPDAVLHGGGEFLVTAHGCILREQFGPHLQNDPTRVARILSVWRPTLVVSEECLLVTRFGIYTWGHWLAELLPKVVLVEARYPGRFQFALPSQVLTVSDPNIPWYRIRESLAAYGIGTNRILGLQQSMHYRFDRLYAVGNVWSDHVMHPMAAEMMRVRLRPDTRPSRGASRNRVGLDRVGDGRILSNTHEIRPLLEAKRFTFHTVGRMPFLEQVSLFQSASVIFAVLGSDLTGLLYAPEGIKVVSVAPAIFGDRFFYALILDRKGTYADLRGPVTDLHKQHDHRSMFRVEPAEVDAAMQALGEGE